MLATLGYDSLDAFIDAVVPEDIRLRSALRVPAAISEHVIISNLRLVMVRFPSKVFVRLSAAPVHPGCGRLSRVREF